MKIVNLYIDESGNLGHGEGRYFLICALDILEEKKKTITRRAGRVIEKYKQNRNIHKSKEIKGWQLKEEGRKELISKILDHDVKVRYIVLDKLYTTILLQKADDKNACYNYLIQLLVKRIIEINEDLETINLYLDNRSVKVGNRLSLKPYLYNKLVLEQLEEKIDVKRIEFNINYLESKTCYLIEWADIISNSLYKKYNRNEFQFYYQIKPYIIYENKFPTKNFGKNTNND